MKEIDYVVNAKDIGLLIKKLRKQKNPKIPQSRLSELIGTALNTYRKMENREIDFPYKSLIEIGDYFEVRIIAIDGGIFYENIPQKD